MEGRGPAAGVAVRLDLLAAAQSLGGPGRLAAALDGVPGRTGRTPKDRLVRVLCRCDFRSGKKGGDRVGPTKKGKGTKLVVVVDGSGVPLACTVHSASPSETKMIEPTLDRLKRQPERLVLDKAYDSEKFRDRLADRGIEPIVPYRKRAVNKKYGDKRKLRRYRRRWIVERTFAWLGAFGRVLVRRERHARIYTGFVHLACMIVTLRQL